MITGLERMKAAAAAAQLQVIADFAASQEAANTAMGIEARQTRRGIPEQIGLARKVSPAAAARQLAQARALIRELPETFELLRLGAVSEHVAAIVVTETSHLAVEDRRLVDKQLAEQLAQLSPRQAAGVARRFAIEADQAGAVQRASNAREDRRVSIRPAPDTMAIVSALLPCEQGVAVYAALCRQADTRPTPDDRRSRGQIMADTLVQRVTGQAAADDISAEIGLIMTDAALFGGEQTPAGLTGYGPIPAQLARTLARRAGQPDDHGGRSTPGSSDPGSHRASMPSPNTAWDGEPKPSDERRARVFLRRLFTDPRTGIITDCDPRRRRFDGVLARLLVCRDRHCRDPYCVAPIRHLDHIRPHAAGGPTTSTNGRGVCERGNYVKDMPGWAVRLIDQTEHLVEPPPPPATPTDHIHRQRPE